MAYITTAEVKAVRQELKKEFPKMKFSVRGQHHTCIYVVIKSGDIDYSDLVNKDGYRDVNHMHVQRTHCDNNPELVKMVNIIRAAPKTVKNGRAYYDKSDSMTDYCDVAYFIYLSIGNWEKPYILN